MSHGPESSFEGSYLCIVVHRRTVDRLGARRAHLSHVDGDQSFTRELNATADVARLASRAEFVHEELRAGAGRAVIVADHEPWRFEDVSSVIEHEAEELLDVIVRAGRFDLPADIKSLLDQLRGLYTQYSRAVQHIIELAPQNRDAAFGAQKNMETIRDRIKPIRRDLSQRLSKRIAALRTAADEAATRNRYSLLAGCAVLLIILTGAGMILIRRVVVPIRDLAAALSVSGDRMMSTAIPGVDRGDEIGLLARAAMAFAESADRVRAMTAEREESERRAAAARRTEMLKLADEFEQAVGTVVQAVSSAATSLECASGTLTNLAERSRDQSPDVANASREVAVSVRNVAARTEELASSIAEIGCHVEESTGITTIAVQEATQAAGKIAALTQAATRIGDVVSLINTVAGQTNLLALNATIEAARAGEAGKGFAVVASEVKQLANQTAKATIDVGTQISAIQASTATAVQAITGISGTIDKISSISSIVASAVEEQSAATRDIANNIDKAAIVTQEVTSNVAGVSSAVGETGRAATQVLQAARGLSDQANQLAAEVDKFIAGVRAA